ncbi:MAG: hypothetical protein NXI00_08335 [Cytophagales bacterium]|nr:hypothetical protein [Cytophagales bacterium]
MIEVKSYTSKTIPTGVILGKGYGSFQMMDEWIHGLARIYLSSTKPIHNETSELIDYMMEKKKNQIEKYIIQVDYEGDASVIKVN